MNDNLNKDISVITINNYAESNPGQLDIIQSGYESTLFQYTAETFQVNNASLEDVNQSFVARTLNDTTRNIRKAFSGIFYNGLRDLRSASLQISDDIFNTYTAEINRSFYIYIVLISCIGMGLVLIGTGLLIPTVFKVMRTTRLVITLFGMIENTDIITLSDRCEKFCEEYLNEGEKKKALSDEKDKSPTHDKDIGAQTETVLAKTEAPVQGLAANNTLAPSVKKENEDEPFDIKTEKLPTLNGNQVHIVPEADGKKDPQKDSNTEAKKNLLNNGEPIEDEKSFLKDDKKKKDDLKAKDKNGKGKDSKDKKNKGKKDNDDKRKNYNE